jgi:hypothetical protein
MLVLVLGLHEAGHWVAMKAFGYRDVQMFFIPFFGAAVSGVPARASPGREAVTLLAGPLPGVLLGTALYVNGSAEDPGIKQLADQLVIINALNLIPVLPFDGGRLIELLFAGRHPTWVMVFAGLSLLAGFGLSVTLLSGPVSTVMLMMAGSSMMSRDRVLRLAWDLRSRRPDWGLDVLALGPEPMRELGEAARRLGEKLKTGERERIELLHREVSTPRTGLGLAIVLVASYGAAALAALAGIVALAYFAPPKWHPQAPADHLFSVELPGKVSVEPVENGVWMNGRSMRFEAWVERTDLRPEQDGLSLDLESLERRGSGAFELDVIDTSNWHGLPAVQTIRKSPDIAFRTLIVRKTRTMLRFTARCDGRYARYADHFFKSISVPP